MSSNETLSAKEIANRLQALVGQAQEAFAAGETVEAVRAKFLGKKSLFTALLSHMGWLSPDERDEVGNVANVVKDRLQEMANKH